MKHLLKMKNIYINIYQVGHVIVIYGFEAFIFANYFSSNTECKGSVTFKNMKLSDFNI